MKSKGLDKTLSQLESEAIYIIREAFASFKKPVLLYSIGKDSSVLLRLAQKAFYPSKIPFPLLHIDTGFKFPEMIKFRDYYINKVGAKLFVHKGESAEAKSLSGEDANTDYYIYHKKTKPLLQAIDSHGFDGAIGGARREEEKSRAKERVFSVRSNRSDWNPKKQRPELWHLYNSELRAGETMRVFPLSNWTETDIWNYILREKIEVVPLYFAERRDIVERNGIKVRVDEFTMSGANEKVESLVCRYRTLGCAPSTGVVPSTATTVEEIIEEVKNAKYSERRNRGIDYTSDSSMEEKKRQGYF